MLAILKGWHGCEVVRNGTIQPGDLIVTKAEIHPDAPNRIAHAMIAGADRWTAYHAVPKIGVNQTSLACSRGILRVYRPNRKDLWASPRYS